MIAGLGLDSIEIDRLHRAAYNPRFLQRIFTPGELQRWEARGRPMQTLAGLFAAKEAAIKALGGLEGCRWVEMEIVPDHHGAPSLVLHGGAAQKAQRMGVVRTQASITHDRSRAIAVVILEREG